MKPAARGRGDLYQVVWRAGRPERVPHRPGLIGHVGRIGNVLEIASYSGITLLGAYLIWVKGKAFMAALRAVRASSWPLS